MPIEPSVSAFISAPFRYAQAEDLAVQAAYSSARIIEVTGRFTTLADAEAMNTILFNMVKSPRRRFTVEVFGVDFIGIDNFAGQTLCCSLKCSRYGLQNGLTTIIVGALIETSKNRTILSLWG